MTYYVDAVINVDTLAPVIQNGDQIRLRYAVDVDGVHAKCKTSSTAISLIMARIGDLQKKKAALSGGGKGK